jgi:membrane protein DedA with SNARE-associated domain
VFFLGLFGNVAGAGVTYTLGRKFGSRAFLHRLEKYAGPTAEQRIRELHKKYGFWGLFVSRFLPGVRAIVPPFAGAIKLPAGRVMLAISTASAVWFALITFLAFRAGDNWDVVQHYIVRSGKVASAIAVAIVVLIAVVWYVKRRNRAARG